MPVDDQYSYALARARAQQKEQTEIQDTANHVVKPPSGTLYAFLYGLAIIGDLMDLTVFTGIGAVLSFIIDIFIGAILFFAGRAARDRINGMNTFQDSLYENIQNMEKKIIAYRNAYARILTASRKSKILRKPVRKVALRLADLRRSVVRSPYGRMIAAIIADLVPFLDLLPWRTVNIYFMKRQEMLAFQDAQNTLPEFMSVKTDVIEAANNLSEAETIEQAA